MSIIHKAIQHKNECAERQSGVPVGTDEKPTSGCYGIDSLFAKKSRRLSFVEFCDGMKDIFLAIPILLFKSVAMAFNFVKRPIHAFAIFCTVILLCIINIFWGGPVVTKNIVAVQNTSPVTLPKPRIISDLGEPAIAPARENIAPVPHDSNARSTRLFENKLREFLIENPDSDVMCSNGRCRLRLKDGVFAEHSTICNNPKIILESSTDDEIVFSDGAGNFCTLSIESLLR
jgi:hypothetical protein